MCVCVCVEFMVRPERVRCIKLAMLHTAGVNFELGLKDFVCALDFVSDRHVCRFRTAMVMETRGVDEREYMFIIGDCRGVRSMVRWMEVAKLLR